MSSNASSPSGRCSAGGGAGGGLFAGSVAAETAAEGVAAALCGVGFAAFFFACAFAFFFFAANFFPAGWGGALGTAAAVPKAPPQPAGKKLTAKKKKAKAHAKKNAAKPAPPLAAVPPLTAVPPRVAAPPVKSPPPAPPPAEHLPDGLDALLDIAYASAEPAPERAVAAYRKALARYPQDSYMPYLVIELSTLYKRLGNYDAALRLFDKALALPIIAKNAVMVQEFRRSRRTLHAVSDMLRARGTPALPFGEVPEDVLAAADRQAGNHT